MLLDHTGTSSTAEDLTHQKALFNIIMDIKLFIQWLESKSPDEVVGFSRSSCECPLATYLKFRHSYYDTVGISIATHGADGGVPWVCLPDWASEFVYRVDSSYVPLTSAIQPPLGITAEKALATIKSIQIDLGY